MSFMARIFGPAQPASAQQQVATNNPQLIQPSIVPGSTPQTAPNGVVPQGSGAPAQTPLDKFADLWDSSKTADGKPVQQQQQTEGLDPQKLLEAAGKADFSNAFDREQLAKVAQGGEEAVTAMLTLLQTATKTAYGQAAVAASKIVETRLGQERTNLESRLPELLRAQRASQDLIEQNPAFANPAVAPLVQMIQDQLRIKYPSSSPAELTRLAKSYLQESAGAFNPQVSITPKSRTAAADTEDWTAYTGDNGLF